MRRTRGGGFGRLYTLVGIGALLQHLARSMVRLLTGFGLAAVTAIPLAMVMGFSATLRRIVDLDFQLGERRLRKLAPRSSARSSRQTRGAAPYR